MREPAPEAASVFARVREFPGPLDCFRDAAHIGGLTYSLIDILTVD